MKMQIRMESLKFFSMIKIIKMTEKISIQLKQGSFKGKNKICINSINKTFINQKKFLNYMNKWKIQNSTRSKKISILIKRQKIY